jgi:hypothetical protein
MLYELIETHIESGFRSDHSLISISFFKKETSDRGPSYWRFNANLLNDTEYVPYIKEKLASFKVKYGDELNHGLKWDLIKMDIRASTICFSKNKATKNRNNIKEIMQKLTNLEKDMTETPSDEQLEQCNTYKSEIEAYNNEKSAGIILRSKADWAELGEKNTKYFLNLEKRNYNNKCITKLIKENNEEITNEQDILNYEKEFYNKLYTDPINVTEDDRDDITALFNSQTVPKISQQNKDSCECNITIEEIGHALRS